LHVCVLIRFHFPRITTHLLRLLHPDERRRQTRDFHKLHLWWVAAEDDATVVLLIRHASGFSVHGDDVLVCGPVLDQGVQGGCEVDGIVHINCSSSRVRHRHTQRQPAAASASPIPSPHLHPSNTLHLATRGSRISDRLTASRPRLLHGRGSWTKTSPGRDGGCDTSHCLHSTAPPPQTRRGVRRAAGACEGECT